MVDAAFKLNIHISLGGRAHRFVSDLNRRLRELGPNEINFGEPHLHLPHITLHMGLLKHGAGVGEVAASLKPVGNATNPFPIRLGPPYSEESREGQYVFVPVEPADRIYSLKGRVADAVSALLESVEWDVVRTRPHVTVAYFARDQVALKSLLEQAQGWTPMMWNALRVATAGARGTCRDILAELTAGGVATDSLQ